VSHLVRFQTHVLGASTSGCCGAVTPTNFWRGTNVRSACRGFQMCLWHTWTCVWARHPAEAKKTLPLVWLPIASCIRLQVVLFDYWEYSTESNPYSLVASTRRIQWSRLPTVLKTLSRGEECSAVLAGILWELLIADQDCFELQNLESLNKNRSKKLLYKNPRPFILPIFDSAAGSVKLGSVHTFSLSTLTCMTWVHSGRHYQYYLCHSIFIIY